MRYSSSDRALKNQRAEQLANGPFVPHPCVTEHNGFGSMDPRPISAARCRSILKVRSSITDKRARRGHAVVFVRVS